MFEIAVSSLHNFKSKNDFILSVFVLWSEGKDQNTIVDTNPFVSNHYRTREGLDCAVNGVGILQNHHNLSNMKTAFLGIIKLAPQAFLAKTHTTSFIIIEFFSS